MHTCALTGFVENQSYDTLCAEMDNVNIPVHCPGATAYRLVATNPRYYPTSINEWGADFTDCPPWTDPLIWRLGEDDGLWAEFLASGSSNNWVCYAPDNPPAGIDETAARMPREINNDWLYTEDIVFTADQDSDFNIEARIGSILTVKMAAIGNAGAGTSALEVRALTLSTNGWVDHGTRVFSASALTATWEIPDHTWREGTDANTLRLAVVRDGEGGQTTTNSWAYFDWLELRQRPEKGNNALNPTVLYSDSNTVVETVWIDFWWRNPRQMKVSVIGGGSNPTSQYLRIRRRMPYSSDWNEIFVLYEDGYARIIPFPPEGLWAVPYGASVILGPTTNCPRPGTGIDEVVIDPVSLRLDLSYENGGRATARLRAHRDGHVVDMSDITYDTEAHALARFRSMWVHDGKADIDRVRNAGGTYPVLRNWSRLEGSWWSFLREVPSYHNTYCPEFRIELIDTNLGFLACEAESFDSATGCAVRADCPAAYGGQVLAASSNGAEAVYAFTLAENKPAASLRIRYADGEAGDGIDHLGNTIRVVLDGARTGTTFSVNTGGSNEFCLTPSLALGDLAAGAHEIRIHTGPGADGLDLDWFELVSQPTASWSSRTVLTGQGEDWTWVTNADREARSGAVGGAAVHLNHTGMPAAVGFDISVPTDYSHAYLRVRCSDDVAPNQVCVHVDGELRAKFPTESTGSWDVFSDGRPVFLGSLTAGTRRIHFTSSLDTYGMDVDEFEIFAFDNQSPSIALDGVYTLPVGSFTSFAVSVSDPDGDAPAIENIARPAGATFEVPTLAWTAPGDGGGTTNPVVFVADDGRGLTNSVVTNRADIVVPADWDDDGLADTWEWYSFETLTNSAGGDADGDLFSNGAEFVAGTDPTNAVSVFTAGAVTPEGERIREIAVVTQPGRRYTILFADGLTNGAAAWAGFADPGRGEWLETNTVSSTHTFTDDEGPETTGFEPPAGQRYYRVKVERP